MEISVDYPQSGYSYTVSRSNWNSEMLVFVQGEKPENPEKNPRSSNKLNKLNPDMVSTTGMEPGPH